MGFGALSGSLTILNAAMMRDGWILEGNGI